MVQALGVTAAILAATAITVAVFVVAGWAVDRYTGRKRQPDNTSPDSD
ncbi:MAG: hypothetical protein NTZ05_19555 [Chloroflexi bacterium]|nr:hypothetical protein [Chloroflexota bacterium]